MKTLTDIEMIELLPASDYEAMKMAFSFDSVSSLLSPDATFLSRAVTTGVIKCWQVKYNNIPAFMLWWHISSDNGLWIDACQSYGSDCPIDIAFMAVEKIKDGKGCKYVRFMTVRGGLVEVAKKAGYRIDGLILVK